MSSYWSKRQNQLYKSMEKDESALKERLSSFYESEYSSLDKEIAAYYQKYGTNNVIEYRTLMQTLSAEDVKLLIEKTDEFTSKYPQYAHLVPVRNSIYKLNRLEGLQYSVVMQQLKIGAVDIDEVTKHLDKQALRGLNAAMETLGFGKNFYSEGADIIKQFVDVDWSNGLNFSSRIWGNTEKLANYLNTDIAQGFARGDSYEKLTARLRTRFENVSRNDAYRLIYTEGTFVMAESTMQPFTEDFEKYKVSTAGDGKVCSICSGIARNEYNIKDRKAGVNFPPFHGWCRCTFEIVVDDWDKWLDDYEKRHEKSGKQLLNNITNNSDKKSNILSVASKIKSKLSNDEQYAINQYIMGSQSYIINEKLRKGISLTTEEKQFIMDLDSALQKLPKYKGDLSRSLIFDNDEDLMAFLNEHKAGNIVVYKEYLSTTFRDVYNPNGQVQIQVLNSENGRDMTAYNSGESEVLYERNSKFLVINIEKNTNGKYDIFVKEVFN